MCFTLSQLGFFKRDTITRAILRIIYKKFTQKLFLFALSGDVDFAVLMFIVGLAAGAVWVLLSYVGLMVLAALAELCIDVHEISRNAKIQ